MSVDESELWEVFDEEAEEENEAETTEISIHALKGQVNDRTIRLGGIVNNKSVSILVDSGSTHNFIQIEVAHALKLDISPIKPFNVITASGDKLKCEKVCKKAGLKIDDLKLEVELFLLPFAGSNIVLGVQWMKTVGKILTDYNDLTMEFE